MQQTRVVPAYGASPKKVSKCGLSLVKTDGLTGPEKFSTISSGSISGGVTKDGTVGTIWIPSAQCGCGIKGLALHYSVPCPTSTEGVVACANPQVRQVSLSLPNTTTAYFANAYDYRCTNRMRTLTATTDGGVGLGGPGNYYSRFLFQNQYEGGNCGYLRVTGTVGTTTLTATTSLNEADGQNCYKANMTFTVQLNIVVGGTQPAGSVRMATECSCV